MDGGVFGLLRLIALHRGAVEYDLRHRFQLGLRDIGTSVTLFEVARLMAIVQADPSSAVAAAIEGWSHPISREALILMDQYDLDATVATGGKRKLKPYRRPWTSDQPEGERIGNPGTSTRKELLDHFRKLGHNLPA